MWHDLDKTRSQSTHFKNTMPNKLGSPTNKLGHKDHLEKGKKKKSSKTTRTPNSLHDIVSLPSIHKKIPIFEPKRCCQSSTLNKEKLPQTLPFYQVQRRRVHKHQPPQNSNSSPCIVEMVEGQMAMEMGTKEMKRQEKVRHWKKLAIQISYES